MTEDVLTFTRNGLLTDLKSQKPDVAIALGREPSSVGDNRLWLYGAYQMDETYARKLNVQPLLRGLIITWASDGLSVTKNLVGDVILFNDDEAIRDHMFVGCFNYDLTDWLNMYERREYYVTVSLGYLISNTLLIGVNPVPFAE